MILDTEKLKDIKLSTDMMNAKAISSYAEKTFVHLSGDESIGTLGLSGSLKLGSPTIYNNDGANTIAVEQAVVGCKGYNIKNLSNVEWIIDKDNSIVTVKASGFTFDSRIKVGDFYSINGSGSSPAWCGKVTEVASDYIKLGGQAASHLKSTVNGIFFPEHPEYGKDIVTGTLGVSLGYGCYAMGPCSYSEGYNNRSSGKYAHTEGNNNRAGWGAHAEGADNAALGIASHSAGRHVSSDTDLTYAWAGDSGKHVVSRKGTFNIYPEGGTLGFYINDKNLSTIIREVVDGKTIPDSKARIIPCTIATIEAGAEKFVNDNISKYVVIGIDEKTGKEITREKTIDEIKEEADHLYAYVDLGNQTYKYKGITTTQHKGVVPEFNTYEWRDLEEHQSISYVKKLGDSNIGTLDLSGMLSVRNDTVLNGKVSEGTSTYAIGKSSHAEGYNNYALGEYSHAEGDGKCYAGTNAFSIVASDKDLSTLTLNAITCEAGSLADSELFGKWITIFQRAGTDGNTSATYNTKFYGVADESTNKISVSYVPTFKNYSNANIFFAEYPLYGTVSLGSGAHAHGYMSHAMEDATAFGCNNYALGRYSFALGNANRTDYMGIAIGSGNSAYGQHSIAMGGNGNATEETIGTNTLVYASKAYGWSGNGKYEVPVSRPGTFNINPVGGLSGVYIGHNAINDIFVALSGDLTIRGHKEFKDGLDVGEYINDVGNNTFAVGNLLTVGSYNFFYKGIDLSDNGYALVYLTNAQPRYPYPFVSYNGNKSSFKILGNTVNVNDTATYTALSTGTNLERIWNCTLDPSPEHMNADNHVWRADYNLLCIDIGEGYQSKTSLIKTCLQSYLADAYVGDINVNKYLNGLSLIGQTITMVNGDKIAYLRCGTVKSVINNNTLCVLFNDAAINASSGLKTGGSRGFSDFDYDDASLVFIDLPILSGPANTSTYSSMNVGILNKVVRRGSLACGKQLTSEADFAFTFGRRGKALHYASFLWAPATGSPITTDKSGTFNIGLNKTLANAKLTTNDTDIRIIGSDNKRERLYQYVWGCISSDANLKTEFKNWLGI